ncbi:MAG: hypothetical protein NDI73_05370 [Desulfuromonadales bacterium]|nr:hypothetical protein [Desulfuromonadales bacterium]
METSIGKFSWTAAILSGIIAGAVFLILALALVPVILGGSPWELPRMIAAIVLGAGVLTPATFNIGIVLTAVGLHFVLSVVYAIIFALIFSRLQLGPALLAGLGAGLVLYVVNFYGFTVLYPWFATARNWVVILDHLVFGVVTAWSYVAIIRSHTHEEVGKTPSIRAKHA